MQIKKSLVANFDGIDVYKYSIIANNNFTVDILNYGGIITGIWVPDKNQIFENVVLNYTNINDYIRNTPYLGAIIGRYAGRIGEGKFTIGGKIYQVAINNNGNNLHGGISGLDKKLFDVEILSDGIKLFCTSEANEEGFPGRVEFEISYRVTAEFELSIESRAIPSEKTLINLTNHTYFNLSSGKAKASAHQLMINSNKFCAVDSGCLFVGEILGVVNTPFDFRSLKPINRDIDNNHPQLKIVGGGYDHPFILNKNADIAAKLFDPNSRRCLEIRTSSEAIVFYSGNFLEGDKQVNGTYYPQKHFGVCLETQNIPNAINVSTEFNSSLYTKEKPFLSKTIWKFKIE